MKIIISHSTQIIICLVLFFFFAFIIFYEKKDFEEELDIKNKKDFIEIIEMTWNIKSTNEKKSFTLKNKAF